MTRAFALTLILAFAGAALADDAGIAQRLAATDSRPADARMDHPLAGRTPLGHDAFCADHRALCTTSTARILPLPIDHVPLLQQVNAGVNATVTFQAVRGAAWRIGAPTGDCDDIAATKLAYLMQAGIPREALRFATALTENGTPHLLLVAWLDTGPLVLDNRRDTLLPPAQTGYRFLAVEWLWGDGFYSWIALGPGEHP